MDPGVHGTDRETNDLVPLQNEGGTYKRDVKLVNAELHPKTQNMQVCRGPTPMVTPLENVVLYTTIEMGAKATCKKAAP